MSRDKRGVVNPVVGGSSPPATAKLNNFRTKHLAESPSIASSAVSARALFTPSELDSGSDYPRIHPL
jgi:hypothetical protein